MPAVSVVVPVHNGERYLRQCLSSIVSQSLADVEIILVDDGSSDGSADTLAEFAAADSRVTIVDGPHIGSAGAARNVGLDLATGEYLAFLDADDFFAPTFLERLYTQAHRDHADVIMTKFRVFDEYGKDQRPVDWPLRLEYFPQHRPFSPHDVGDALFLATNPAAWNKLFRRDFIKDKGIRFQHLVRTNDAFFTFVALAHAERLSYVDAHLITYRTGNVASLRGSRAKSPLAWADALDAIQGELQSAGIYDEFERAFTNLALDFCLANLRRPPNAEAFLVMHEAVTTVMLDKFGIRGRPLDYFIREEMREQLIALLNMTATEYLFDRFMIASAGMERARSDARTSQRELDRFRRNIDAPSADSPNNPAKPDVPQNSADGPDVSVIVRCHNDELFLNSCLESIRTQTDVKVTIVAVDLGSSDLSAELLHAFAEAHDGVTVIEHSDRDHAHTLNTAVAASIGRYVCIVNGSDRLLPGALATLVAQADQGRLEVLCHRSIPADDAADDGSPSPSASGNTAPAAQPTSGSGAEVLAALRLSSRSPLEARRCLISRPRLLALDPVFLPETTATDDLFVFRALVGSAHAEATDYPVVTFREPHREKLSPVMREGLARSYFHTYLEMLQHCAPMSFSPNVAEQLGVIVATALRKTRANFIRIDVDADARVPQDRSSVATWALYAQLQHERSQHKIARRAVVESRQAAARKQESRASVSHWLRSLLRRLR